MVQKIYKLLFNLSRYQTEGISSKIEFRRAQVFNIAILLECFILLINGIRHYLKSNFNSVILVSITFCVFLILYATKKLERTKKYFSIISIGLIVTFIFIHFIDKSKDIIQVYLAILITTALFLNGRKFYFLFLFTIFVYYFTFFSQDYQKNYNPLGALIFIILTLMIRLFVIDAKKNEELIEKQYKELKEVDIQKTRLFSNISHEIRTPLTLILGANEQLSEIKENQKISRIITNNSNRLLELVNQILELSKIEAKQRKIVLTEIVLSDYLNTIVQSFDILSLKKEIKFTYILNDLANPIYIDIDAFSKIIVNLLSNAFKFSDKNDNVKLIIRKTNDDYLDINVIDSGKGISEEQLPFIFNQYYHSNIGLEASSGIGLALVKELVILLKGSIFVNSKLNIGTSFNVKLPCSLNYYNDSKNKIEIISINKEYKEIIINENNNFNLIESNINDNDVLLIVEDNEDLREFISEIASTQFKVILAKDGLEGFEFAKQFIPDIILSDIMMPRMNGYEMLEKLKLDELTSHIPVVMLTAKSDEQDILKGLSLQADDYILKPFSKKELLLRLTNKIQYRNKIRKQLQEVFIENEKQLESIPIFEDAFLLKLNSIIFKNLSNSNFGAEELSKEIGLSSSQLFRKIKAVTNLSVSIYIRNIRLEEAKKLLLNDSNINITEVAYDTGFSTINYFSKCFKDYTGKSPKEYSKERFS